MNKLKIKKKLVRRRSFILAIKIFQLNCLTCVVLLDINNIRVNIHIGSNDGYIFFEKPLSKNLFIDFRGRTRKVLVVTLFPLVDRHNHSVCLLTKPLPSTRDSQRCSRFLITQE